MDVLKIISNCMEDMESIELILGNEGMKTLLQLIMTPTDPDVQANAIKVISRAAQSCTQTQTLVLLCQASCTCGLNLRTNPTCFISCKVSYENCSELMKLL